MRIVRFFAEAEGSVEGPSARAVPLPSVVEDDDSVRIFAFASTPPPACVEEAVRLGVSYFARPTAAGWEMRSLDDGSAWQPTPELSVRAMMDHRPKSRWVHLHTHSEFSALDGLSTVEEIVATAVRHGQPAVAITDHGVCASHVALDRAARAAGIRPIFGIEAYLVDDRHRRMKASKPKKGDYASEGEYEVALRLYEQDRDAVKDYYHLVLWAQSSEGLRNLWALSTEAHMDGYYRHPRMDWESLARHSEGVLASTACLRGPVSHAWLDGDEPRAQANFGRLLNIFGDRLWGELHTNGLGDQVEANLVTHDLATRHGLGCIAVSDSHYSCVEHSQVHRVWLAMQTGQDLNDDSDLFAGDAHYHLLDEGEALRSLDHLPAGAAEEAIRNTVTVAEQCDASLPARSEAPVFSRQGGATSDIARLRALCEEAWSAKVPAEREDEYRARLETEMGLLESRGFCGYFLMVSDYVRWAKQHGILVGPGRGSGGGSLVAYLTDIIDIDPVRHGLIFERFLNPGRAGMPDFDVDFPASRRDEVQGYIQQRYGESHVARVGTHIRLQNKGVIRDLARTLRTTVEISYPDIDAICAAIDDAEASTAGLGLSWDDVMEQAGLQPWAQKYPELFALAEVMVGRLKTYGKHPAGLVVAPDADLIATLPMRRGDDGIPVTDFDLDALEQLGLLKFDILTLRTLDTLQYAVDLIEQTTGQRLDFSGWDAEYDDPLVWEFISEGHTFGCFQIETSGCTTLCVRFGPRSLRDLADVITLIRPGPQRSGLTETYFRRRSGMESVTYTLPDLEPILSDTFGCILYQEQVMKVCEVLAGYTLAEADDVRRILGKKKVEAIEAEGVRFVAQAVALGHDRGAVEHLWAQITEFSRYSFTLSHAFGYAMLAVWTAWVKYHFPQQYGVALLSTLPRNRVVEACRDLRRRGWSLLPPDANTSGHEFSMDDAGIRFGLSDVTGVNTKAVESIIANRPYTSVADFVERSGVGAETVMRLVRVGALDTLEPHRAAAEAQAEWLLSKGVKCANAGSEVAITSSTVPRTGSPATWTLPCTFDWASEPVELGASGRPKKRKDPPKRCSVKCRQYVPADLPSFAECPHYTVGQVRDVEVELLGMAVSSTPFDDVPEDDREQLAKLSDLSLTTSEVSTMFVVQSVRKRKDRAGRSMAFLSVEMEDGEADIAVFSSVWEKHKVDLRKGAFMFARVKPNDRGIQLVSVNPV